MSPSQLVVDQTVNSDTIHMHEIHRTDIAKPCGAKFNKFEVDLIFRIAANEIVEIILNSTSFTRCILYRLTGMEGMLTDKGSAYRLRNHFRHHLEKAKSVKDIVQVFSHLFPLLNATAAAILTQSIHGCHKNMTVAEQIGAPCLWQDYLALCHANKEPFWRTLRLIPHPIALSDIRHHRGLRRRSSGLSKLLAEYRLNDAFAVPLFDQHLKFSTVMIVGPNLRLSPTNRYLITQAAADLMARVAIVRPEQMEPQPPLHHKLTPRQIEIATWLVAGKTDWEIGEILQISPKTVNFHVENIKRAYGVRSRNQFVAAVVQEGSLPLG